MHGLVNIAMFIYTDLLYLALIISRFLDFSRFPI